MDRERLALFALDASRDFGRAVSEALGVSPSGHEEREFEDGEHKARSLVNVRDRDVFVVQSLYGDAEQTVNDKLCRLLFFLGALRDAAAGRVTAVVPYLCYARKDRRTKPRDPVTTRYVAKLFEAVGADRILTMDVHNLVAFENAFDRTRPEHLQATKLFVQHFADRLRGEDDLVVVSPDVGGVKRAEQFREALARALGASPGSGFMEKQRSGGVVRGEALVGDVEGRTAILIDDLISGGTTLLRAAQACKKRGAKAVHGAATHGVFSPEAEAKLDDPALDSIVVTDTVPPFRLSPRFVERKVTVLDASRMFAEAVRRMHDGGSIVELNEA
ncbi:MAG: ribose-phosphate pyrophosphokinase [Planctomycetales bacterium]